MVAVLATGEAGLKSRARQSRLWKRYRRWSRRDWTCGSPGSPVVTIMLVTYNRLGMLKECVSSILANSDDTDYELIIWDNASTDGTGEYLDSTVGSHPHVRLVHGEENIGMNAYAACVRLARGEYLLSLDDDVVEVPKGWLTEMMRSFDAVPRAGYLATNVVQDEATNGAKPGVDRYRAIDYGDGVIIEHGPTGAWCTLTSKSVVKRLGNFLERPGRVFYLIDGDFGARCLRRGYRVGIVRNVRVYHAAGVVKNKEYGYLELCRQKYAESPEFEEHLAATLAAMDQPGGIPS
ncbi:MAG: glycosyltransferase [Thermoleophilia bacterium]|nr:glycosyltransferase [Thermoleophilia bacterium]